MKAHLRFLLAAALMTAATGCEKFLDINANPNSLTEVTANNLLANALTITAANYTGGQAAGTNYNSYASFAAGFWGKSGVVSGFSEERTYNYSSTYQQILWQNTYDNLNDYNLIQKQAAAYPNHAAIARIMKVYNFQLLVDQYGDIPYTQALQGAANVAPAYDKAEDIYKDFIVQLKGANADIVAAASGLKPTTEDVVFRGDMTKWKQFSNTLRLRVLMRMSQVPSLTSYVSQEMTALQAETDGFIVNDVVAQPTYAANSNQQNPFYNRYGFAVGSTNATSEYSYVMPTNYILSQYQSNSDPRIAQLYRQGRLADNTAAYVGTDLGEANPPIFPATGRAGSRFLQGGTFLRGANAPTVLMLLAEAYFLKSEAETRNLLPGGDASASTDFQNGIKASFLYTYRTATDLAAINAATVASATASTPGVTQYDQYVAANTTNGLVNWAANTTTVREGTDGGSGPLTTPRTVTKQEKIIYQKYLATNTVASTEAWAEYRRTGLPKIKPSLQSGITSRADKLPTRLLYPQTEVSTNQANVPTGITTTTKIFWDVVD